MNAKEVVLRMLETLADDVTFEGVQYHVAVCAKIENARRQVRERRVLQEAEMERRFAIRADDESAG